MRRRKTKGDDRERERKVVSVDGRLLRPCSRSFPLNSSTSGRRGGRRRMESQDDAREPAGWERERDPRDEKGSTGESCEALRRMARLRGCCARGIKSKREKGRSGERGKERTEAPPRR